MDSILALVNSVPIVVGIALVATWFGGKTPLVAGIVLIILGVLIK